MSLLPGTRLGAYEVLEHIGAGGMGDVYRARDTRLDRTVALKVVRTDFSERFEREAKAISALNHPHICALYDVGSDSVTAGDAAAAPLKVDFLIMEFVEGRPLAGPMPVEDVLRFGIQICEALEAAHKKGIVHRDLKPANVLITKAGVKLLDFGLARLRPSSPAGPSSEQMTVAALTGAHTIVGTPQYMAPEQIEGREADARADIFALGCVLYELLTGRRAFDGKTASNVMAAILATEPRRVTELVPLAPAALEWVVHRCLEKDPDARWQNAGDVALQLRWLSDHRAAGDGTAAQSPRARRSWLGGLAAGIALAAVAAAAWIWMRPPASTGGRMVSATITLPTGMQYLNSGDVPAVAYSPDGRTLALSLFNASGTAAYLRSLDGLGLTKVAGSEGIQGGPAFSPDGQWLAFARRGELVKLPVGGGAAVSICSVGQLRGFAWLSDDTLVVVPIATVGLMRVSANGGTPQPLTTLNLDRHEKTHRTPFVLPGGKTVLMTAGPDDVVTYDGARIVAVSLETGTQKDLVDGGYAPAYSPTGHLLYVRDSSLFAVPFDPKTLEVGRTPVKIVDQIASTAAYGTAQYVVGPEGTLLYATGGDLAEIPSLYWQDRKGAITTVGLPARPYDDVEFSPDGKRVLVLFAGANQFYWIYDIADRQLLPLTHRYDALDGIWTPDGAHVTYSVGSEIRSIITDGSGVDEVLIPSSLLGNKVAEPKSWSPDGKTLVLDVGGQGTNISTDIMLYSVDRRELTPLVATPFNEFGGRISPDGKWLAYASDDSGTNRIYLRELSGSPARYSVGPGVRAFWTLGGRELVITGPAGDQSVSVRPGERPEIGTPRPWGPTSVLPDGLAGGDFSLSPDGSRVIFVGYPRPKTISELGLVLNWTGGPVTAPQR